MSIDLSRAPKALLRAQKLAHLTDSILPIPLIGKRIGFDAIVGLIPGLGDLIMFVESAYIVLLAKTMGLPTGLRLVMLRNCLIDFVLGLLPVVGDIVDIFYQANKSNVRIMERYWLAQHRSTLDESVSQNLSQWEQNQR